MGRADHFFTYRLLNHRTTKRLGKGGVSDRGPETVASYLRDAYGVRGWTHFELEWHSNEGAAFKAERRNTDTFVQATGALPPWNALRGGSGGSSFVSCKATLANGERCLSLARAGNYGFCGRHR
jgi:hypothetical protein